MLINIQATHLNQVSASTLPLYDIQTTRLMERTMAAQLPPHTLMTRAGTAIARLARALAPHAKSIWIACGPGNNGGDGLMAAALLQPWVQLMGIRLHVSWCGNMDHLPLDAAHAMHMAKLAGVAFTDTPPDHVDLAIDALLGLGGRSLGADTTPPPQLRHWQERLGQCAPRLLCVDIPSGLNADDGTNFIAENSTYNSDKKVFCLTFITAKPGLFTAQGRDWAGEVWLDDLGWTKMPANQRPVTAPVAWLGMLHPRPGKHPAWQLRHNSHKGQFGDVWVLGGQGLRPTGVGMVGAAMLAAKAALHGRAGRVFVVMLDEDSPSWDESQPELMLRSTQVLQEHAPLPTGAWVCGCGGGESVIPYLPKLLKEAKVLVLDADALNAIAASPDLQSQLTCRLSEQHITVLTPHPLEAARLLGWTSKKIQAHRLEAARQLAQRYQCVCVLKGSGTVLSTASGLLTINASGNSRLSTAGTGDVLAGLIGATLAPLVLNNTMTKLDEDVHSAVAAAVHEHGRVADHWSQPGVLTASALASRLNLPASTPSAATA
jgi:hydroxyethylthiazole kinase-like uncharacterized protein yjeF